MAPGPYSLMRSPRSSVAHSDEANYAVRSACPDFRAFRCPLTEARKRLEERRVRVPRLVGLLQSAEERQGLLDRGKVANRGELAARPGVSVRRVGRFSRY